MFCKPEALSRGLRRVSNDFQMVPLRVFEGLPRAFKESSNGFQQVFEGFSKGRQRIHLGMCLKTLGNPSNNPGKSTRIAKSQEHGRQQVCVLPWISAHVNTQALRSPAFHIHGSKAKAECWRTFGGTLLPSPDTPLTRWPNP